MAPYSSFVKMGGNDERSIPSTTFERIIPTVTSYLSASSFKDLGQVEKNAVMADISGVTTAIADNAARSDYRVDLHHTNMQICSSTGWCIHEFRFGNSEVHPPVKSAYFHVVLIEAQGRSTFYHRGPWTVTLRGSTGILLILRHFHTQIQVPWNFLGTETYIKEY